MLPAKLLTDANLKGFWPFQENGNDMSPNAHHLTPTGSPTYVPGRFGNCVRIPLNTSSFAIADALDVNGGACSISLWLQQEADIASGAVNFIQQNAAGTDTGNSISYEYNAGTRRLYFRRSRWGVTHQGPYYNIALGTILHHIVYTYDGTNVRGYVDNVLVAGPTAASGNGTDAVPDFFLVAGVPYGAVKHDALSFYNKALSVAEIDEIFNAGKKFFQMF